MDKMKKNLDLCRKPLGSEGKEMVERMNKNHYEVTGWGLQMLSLQDDSIVIDLGCGGGKTVERLAVHTPEGKVYGLDYSEDCVEWANELNKDAVREGKAVIIRGDVTNLPFDDEVFDVATAVETVYFWPDLETSFKEIYRILKNGGEFLIINEAYPHKDYDEKNRLYEEAGGMVIPSPEDLHAWFTEAGFKNVSIEVKEENNWLRGLGKKEL